MHSRHRDKTGLYSAEFAASNDTSAPALQSDITDLQNKVRIQGSKGKYYAFKEKARNINISTYDIYIRNK